MVPISRKRTTPEHSEGENSIDEPLSKKRCVELPQTPPPDDAPKIDVSREPLFDDDVRQLLSRSVATTLKHVGFDGATEEALEGICSEVSTCQSTILHF